MPSIPLFSAELFVNILWKSRYNGRQLFASFILPWNEEVLPMREFRRMHSRHLAIHKAVCAALMLFAAAAPSPAGRAEQANAVLRQAILTAEHNRARTEADMALLLEASNHKDPEIQRLAVRALGRLERPEVAERIRSMLNAAAPAVRREAATAFVRALVTESSHAAAAGAILRTQLAREQAYEVRASLCEALGRLSYQTAADVQQAEVALVAATRSEHASDAPPVILLGAVRGLEALVRLRLKVSLPAPATLERLRRLSISAKDAPVRRLALATLVTSGKLDGAFLAEAFKDSDSQVRRHAVRGSASLPSGDAGAEAVLARALKDSAAMVRFEALNAYSRQHRSESCAAILTAVRDQAPSVALQAIDLLGGGCTPDHDVRETLTHIAGGLPPGIAERGWHAPAHAFAALAKIAPELARPHLEKFASHPQWQVRSYAARAARTIGDFVLLEELARDRSDNVRTAAIGGLITGRRHEADALYLEALAARDYQLINTAARGLAGTPDKASAAAALLASLARLTADRSDTSRDPRVAMLQRLRELGSAENAAALKPYLSDFDPRVASLAAEALTVWTGTQQAPITAVEDPGPAPQLAEVESLASATAVVTMRTGGSFELRLLAAEAPGTVLRFVRLARAGYYNGLTFHRVEPNFVIQGGSPGANEYMGDSHYMRDEIGRLMHERGTAGISTRGRDTGDAQIFINLVDNPRLDPDYTVFAKIVRGLEIIDRILEGDTIERIEIRGAQQENRVPTP
jgi:cyclophilin family peptidyl-prolyl cis-trans isomerase/HEAT repeat protein